MFLSSVNSIINSTFFGSHRQSSRLAIVVGMQKNMRTLGVNGLSLVRFTHSSFLFQQLFSAQSQSKSSFHWTK
jgi:hypothetical protein